MESVLALKNLLTLDGAKSLIELLQTNPIETIKSIAPSLLIFLLIRIFTSTLYKIVLIALFAIAIYFFSNNNLIFANIFK